MRVNVQDVTYSLKSLMWRQLGVERHAESMTDAAEKIELWTRAVRELAPEEPATFELLNMLTVARLVGLGALLREESRGVHHRTDFPRRDAGWRAHTQVTPCFEKGAITEVIVRRDPVTEGIPTA